MAFDPDGLDIVVSSISGGIFRIASYRTSNTRAQVTASGYFTNAARYGLKLESLVVVLGEPGAGQAAYLGKINSISAAGHATFVVTGSANDVIYPNVEDWRGHHGDASDTNAIQSAIDELSEDGSAELLLSRDYTVQDSITLKTGVVLAGAGPQRPTILLGVAVNKDVLVTQDFATLTGTNNYLSTTPHDFGLRNVIIDGNRANQTSATPDRQNGLTFYGYRYSLERVMIQNAFGHGLRTEWGEFGEFGMEASVSELKVDTCGRHGIWFQGPHDTDFKNAIVIDASQAADDTYHGLFIDPYGSGRFSNVHTWHRSTVTNRMAYGLKSGGGNEFESCLFEGAHQAGHIEGNDWSMSNCSFFANYSTDPILTVAGAYFTVKGLRVKANTAFDAIPLQIGTVATGAWAYDIDGTVFSEAAKAVTFVNDDGGKLSLRAEVTDASALYTGTLDVSTELYLARRGSPGTLIQRQEPRDLADFTPTATFTTPGDFAPTYTIQEGKATKVGNRIFFTISLLFTTNAYTTASGSFRLGGLPLAKLATGSVSVSAGRIQNVVATGHVAASIAAGNSYFTFHSAVSAAAGTFWGTSQIPASTSNILIELSGHYDVA